jgi:hypothetical protein
MANVIIQSYFIFYYIIPLPILLLHTFFPATLLNLFSSWPAPLQNSPLLNP